MICEPAAELQLTALAIRQSSSQQARSASCLAPRHDGGASSDHTGCPLVCCRYAPTHLIDAPALPLVLQVLKLQAAKEAAQAKAAAAGSKKKKSKK